MPWVSPSGVTSSVFQRSFISAGGGPSVPAALGGPTAWYDAKDAVVGVQTITDRVTGTKQATRGTTGGADAADAVILAHDGTNHFWYGTGIAGNNVSASASITISATTDLIMEWDFGPNKAPLPASSTYCAGGADVTNYGMMLYMEPTAYYRLYYNGTSANLLSSAGATAYRYVRGRHAEGTGVYIEGRDSTGDSWTEIASNSDTSAINTTGGVPMLVGAVPYLTTANTFKGEIYSMTINQDGVDTHEFNPARDIDVSADIDAGQTSFVDATSGLTWTFNRSTADRVSAIVTRSILWLDGFQDYLFLPAADTPDQDKSGRRTQLVVCRTHGHGGTDGIVLGNGSLYQGQTLYFSGGLTPVANYRSAGTNNVDTGTAITAGDMTGIASVLGDDAIEVYDRVNGLSGTPTTTTSITPTYDDVAIGGGYNAGVTPYAPYPLEVLAVLIYDDITLTEVQLNAAVDYILGDYT